MELQKSPTELLNNCDTYPEVLLGTTSLGMRLVPDADFLQQTISGKSLPVSAVAVN